jgi:hypothetical protein
MVKTVSVDFDGVIHSYDSRWKGADVIPDPPVPGAIRWLADLCQDDRFEVCIFSSRNAQDGGIDAMKSWLLDNGLPTTMLEKIQFPLEKPMAVLIVDDRAFHFEGTFPSLEFVAEFKPWNKK